MTEKKRIDRKYVYYALRYIGIPVLLEIIIETLNRKSFVGGITYFFERPALFVFNTLIIMLTVSIALFFKREIFVFTTISVIWLVFGIVNFVILHFRVTPFSAVDITLLESAISVSGHYLNALNIAMIGLAAVLVVVSIVCLYRMAPKHSHTTQKKLIVSGVCVALICLAIVFLRKQSNSVQALTTNYTNISEAYENYGFVYCFTNSIIDVGITEPEDYSEESVNEILDKIPEEKTTRKEEELPNIIFIQLESFFDVDTVKDLKLSADAIPNFHRLQNEYSNGLLTVPTVGAGTVNTEFEILTGLSQKDFGTSEYPYKTILRETTSESICYNLKNLGYKSHCVHNNEGTFYGRNKVFENLGFDTFTSMEYMTQLEDNPNGWKKDDVLVDEILKSLDSTSSVDFVLGLTVQSHGKYAGFPVSEDAPIKVESAPEGMEESYAYYVNQLYEVDRMIGKLTEELQKRQEHTVLVLYGDHLPSLDIKKEDLTDTTLYHTQYVVWDNMGLQKEEKNLAAYQLYASVLDRIGIHEGTIARFHQNALWKTKTYHSELKTLAYDMLYGENYAYHGEKPFQQTQLQMGSTVPKIMGITRCERGYLVQGMGFTPYAHILFEGKEVETEWISANQILITEEIAFTPEEEVLQAEEEKQSEENETSGEEAEEKKGDILNGFYIEVRTDGGTVLSESALFQWSEY